jgi:hypothetical protein
MQGGIMKNHVWVIEQKDGKKWLPTDEFGLTRREARKVLTWISCASDACRYRVRQYVPKEDK